MAEDGLRVLRDDPSLDGDIPLLRQVNPKRAAPCVDWDSISSGGFPKLRAGAFQRASKQMAERYGYPERTLSVFVEDAVLAEYETVAAWAQSARPGWGVVRITAGALRQEGGYLLERDDLNEWVGHTVAWPGVSGRKADSAQHVLAVQAEWVVAPDPGCA